MAGRYRSKVDSNQPEIIKTFRALGCSVCPLHFVGQGFPDLIVAKHGVNVLVEVKDGQKVPSARKLTADEQAFHDAWQGWIEIIESQEDAVTLVNKIVPRGTL